MITKIELENFKGIGERQTIELKPITLLFGANSSGKSTIIQALHYAHEIFERHNLDPDRTLLGGEDLDLGGFKNLVHNHDLSNKIKLKFHIDIEDIEYPDYGIKSEWAEYLDYARNDLEDFSQYKLVEIYSIPHETETVWIELEISWSEFFQTSQLTKYTVGLNNTKYASINASLDGRKISLEEFNFEHSFLKKNDDEVSSTSTLGEFINFIDSLFKTIYETDSIEVQELSFPIPDQKSALPVWGKLLEEPQSWKILYNLLNKDRIDYEKKMFEEDNYTNNPYQEILPQFERLEYLNILSQAIVGPGEILRDELRKLRYLGPLRSIPPRYYEPSKSIDKKRWSNGLAAWDQLFRNDNWVTLLNLWLSDKDKLNTSYEIYLKDFQELESGSEIIRLLDEERMLEAEELLRDELERLPQKRKLVLIDQKSGIEVHPPDIGVGISQLIPVVVAALDSQNKITAIEQPELHIHPAMQVALGDLFIEEISKMDRLFIIETHSEHLMLRLLRRIRETSSGELPDKNKALEPTDLSVIYVEQKNEETYLSQLRIDEDGEFIDHWPKGFFEERAEELFS